MREKSNKNMMNIKNCVLIFIFGDLRFVNKQKTWQYISNPSTQKNKT